LKDYQIHTYEDASEVIKEIGFLPLAPLVPGYPSLDSITSKDQWYTGSEFDPWMWRAKFPVEGVAAYGKFVKKKSVLISRELLPFVRAVLGSNRSIKERYHDGLVSREALDLFNSISEEEGIDSRVLRVKAGMKEKEKKKLFDYALLELQGFLDIAVSGTKEKTDLAGEKNGWSSMSYETMDYWAQNKEITLVNFEPETAKIELKNHFEKIAKPESLKALNKIFKL
jgi:hypothetical protein